MKMHAGTLQFITHCHRSGGTCGQCCIYCLLKLVVIGCGWCTHRDYLTGFRSRKAQRVKQMQAKRSARVKAQLQEDRREVSSEAVAFVG